MTNVIKILALISFVVFVCLGLAHGKASSEQNELIVVRKTSYQTQNTPSHKDHLQTKQIFDYSCMESRYELTLTEFFNASQRASLNIEMRLNGEQLSVPDEIEKALYAFSDYRPKFSCENKAIGVLIDAQPITSERWSPPIFAASFFIVFESKTVEQINLP